MENAGGAAIARMDSLRHSSSGATHSPVSTGPGCYTGSGLRAHVVGTSREGDLAQ